MRKRTEIFIETDRFIVIRHRHHKRAAWCAACRGEVPMDTEDEVTTVVHTSSCAIDRLTEAEELSNAETWRSQATLR